MDSSTHCGVLVYLCCCPEQAVKQTVTLCYGHTVCITPLSWRIRSIPDRWWKRGSWIAVPIYRSPIKILFSSHFIIVLWSLYFSFISVLLQTENIFYVGCFVPECVVVLLYNLFGIFVKFICALRSIIHVKWIDSCPYTHTFQWISCDWLLSPIWPCQSQPYFWTPYCSTR